MNFTDILQKCYSTTDASGVVTYRVENTIQTAGELPRSDIFIYEIKDAEDSSIDSFLRLASLADLQTALPDRDQAILAGVSTYADLYAAFSYTDLETAVAAKPTITARINDLINLWVQYRDSFYNAGTDTIALPTSTKSELDALIAVYRDAVIATDKARVLSDEADVTYNAALTTLSADEATLAIYNTQKDFCLVTIQGQYPAYVSFVTDGLGESTSATAYRTNVLTPAMNSFYASTLSSINTWTQTINNGRKTVSDTLTAKIKADTVLASAQTEQYAALAAILSVYPSFDLTTL
jgi:hypothetical protein